MSAWIACGPVDNGLGKWTNIDREWYLRYYAEYNKYTKINIMGPPDDPYPRSYTRFFWVEDTHGNPDPKDTAGIVLNNAETKTSSLVYEVLLQGWVFDGSTKVLREGEIEIPFQLGECLEAVAIATVKAVDPEEKSGIDTTLHADYLVLRVEALNREVHRKVGSRDRLVDLWVELTSTLHENIGFRRPGSEPREWEAVERQCSELLKLVEAGRECE